MGVERESTQSGDHADPVEAERSAETKARAKLPEHAQLPEKAKAQPFGEDCARCGKPLMLRMGRRSPFVVCSGYPACRNTRNLPQTTRSHPETNVPSLPAPQQRFVSASEILTLKEELRQIAFDVDRALTAYIEVHDSILRDTGTLKSLVKNLFGFGVPMSESLHRAEQLLPVWSALQVRAEAFRREADHLPDREQKSFADCLSRYTAAVTRAIASLIDRQRLLHERSNSAAGRPITWAMFQEKERQYKAAVSDYVAIGEELNRAARAIF